MLATRGMFNDMSRLKTMAPGEKFPTSARTICPMTLCAASMIALAVGVCGVMLTALMPAWSSGN